MYGACLSNYNSLVYRICFRLSEFLFPLNQNLGPLQEPIKVKFLKILRFLDPDPGKSALDPQHWSVGGGIRPHLYIAFLS